MAKKASKAQGERQSRPKAQPKAQDAAAPAAPARIASPQDLKALRDRVVADIDLRAGAKDMRITVHMGTCGIAAGAREILMELMSQLADAGATNVSLQQAACAGLCDKEPMITLADKSGATFRYGPLDRAKARKIVHEHVQRGIPVTELLLNV
ncbi:MAG: (2Fe-2S) ferredoxin domain-containing protein [Phycisphaerae bacterium]